MKGKWNEGQMKWRANKMKDKLNEGKMKWRTNEMKEKLNVALNVFIALNLQGFPHYIRSFL